MIRTFKPLAQLLLTGTALTSPLTAGAGELPYGASAVHGGVSIATPSANQMTIQQTSPSAIVNWQGFSIGQGSRVDIVQPSSSSAILNRVTGSTPSTIAGQLNANGQVYLVNPNGIAITRSGTVNAGAFVASTLDTSDQDFKAGRRVFRGTGQSATVSNQGSITVQQGGFAALLGGRVENTGLISVPLGKVGLGAGEQATLDFSGDGFLQVAIPSRKDGSDAALIRHSGTIKATGGTVVMQAATARDTARNAINLSGLVEARSVSGRSGAVVLGGGEGGTVTVSGRVDTSARGAGPRHGGAVRTAAKPVRGGDITVTGDAIRLAGATLKADGTAGGGSIRVGGGFQGQGPLQRASTTTVDAATSLSADAGRTGRGGDVVVWSDQMTRFSGRISATGGAQGGDGGQAEVSSHGVLDYAGTAVLTAAKGAFGTLLLDPYNVTISNGSDTNQSGFTATGNDSVINAGTLQAALGTANVTVSTGGAGSPGSQAGDITVAAPVTWGTGAGGAATTLTLNASRSIAVNANLAVVGDGGLALNTNQGGTGGALSFGTGASASFLPASATSTARPAQTLVINSETYQIIRPQDFVTTLPATLLNPDLAGGRFALAGNVDAGGRTLTSPINGTPAATGAPGGTNVDFTGKFNGLGHSVSNLNVTSSNQYVGLFGRTVGASIESLNLANVNVRSTYSGAGAAFVGGLAGEAVNGSVSRVTVSGTVSGSSAPVASSYTGGVIGSSSAVVTNVTSNATVSGGSTAISSSTPFPALAAGSQRAEYQTGGVIGRNNGTLTQAFATGAVSGTGLTVTLGSNSGSNSSVSSVSLATLVQTGGLVGASSGTVSQANATGAVTGGRVDLSLTGGNGSPGNSGTSINSSAISGFVRTGGLIGDSAGPVSQAYATGNVTGGSYNLTLNASSTAPIQVNSSSLSGSNETGGLIGYQGGSSVTQTYSTSAVTGGTFTLNATLASLLSVRSPGSTFANTIRVGGLIGANDGSVRQSYATGGVTSGQASQSLTQFRVASTLQAGGLVGSNTGSIDQTYANNSVFAYANNTVGALIGANIQAAGTGTSTSGTISSSFWNTENTQAPAVGNGVGSGGATGLTTAQFQDSNGFVTLASTQGWDFRSVWAPPGGGFTPQLYSISPVVAVFPDAQSRVAGDPNPTLTGNVYGGPGAYVFRTADAPLPSAATLLTTDAPSSGPAGTYTIRPVAGPVTLGGTGYRVTGVTAPLTVTPAPTPPPVTVPPVIEPPVTVPPVTVPPVTVEPVPPVTVEPVPPPNTNQTPAQQANTASGATVTPNVVTVLPNLTAPSLTLASTIDLSGSQQSITLGGGGPTLGVGQSSAGDGAGGARGGSGSGTVSSANRTLSSINGAAQSLEAKLANCDRTQPSTLGGYSPCVATALEGFADELNLQVQQLPPAFRNIPAVIREAARQVRVARTVTEARAAVRVAVAAVRKAIALLRADEPAVARIQQRQGQAIATALRAADARLSKAVGL